MGDLFNTILYPIEWLVAWIMYGFHEVFTAMGMPAASGLAWGLSIVGLVIVMRAAMIPLFVKQINASRKMQLIQPQLQKIQKKYKGKSDPESRQAMTQETMELYRKEGTNPFSSCLPILVQSPFFFGLFRVLNGLKPIAEGKMEPIGPITQPVAAQAESATIFGAPLSATFLGSTSLNVKIVAGILIVLMSVTTFTTQRQLMMKNMPASALDNPFAKQQKLLLYIMPVVFAVSGVNFPIGVLLYWFTTNVWSMVQQFYVIRRMPAPGSAAEKAYHARLVKRGKPVPGAAAVSSDTEVSTSGADDGSSAEAAGGGAGSARPSGQRAQPKGKKRKKSGAAPRPGGPAGTASRGAGATGAAGAAEASDGVLPATGSSTNGAGTNGAATNGASPDAGSANGSSATTVPTTAVPSTNGPTKGASSKGRPRKGPSAKRAGTRPTDS
jgi:YidC/Oxa1 family membrane protein insertase